jgi:hypothetical protein
MRLPQPRPTLWGPAKGAALFRLWCTQELGPNGCRNLEEMLREKLKHISSLLRLDASVEDFLGA